MVHLIEEEFVDGTNRDSDQIVLNTNRDSDQIVYGTNRDSDQIVYGTNRDTDQTVYVHFTLFESLQFTTIPTKSETRGCKFGPPETSASRSIGSPLTFNRSRWNRHNTAAAGDRNTADSGGCSPHIIASALPKTQEASLHPLCRRQLSGSGAPGGLDTKTNTTDVLWQQVSGGGRVANTEANPMAYVWLPWCSPLVWSWSQRHVHLWSQSNLSQLQYISWWLGA